MRINLLFGFLGSGKTTLARHLLEERGSEVPTAVIVNEFGDVGIDGEILKGNNVDMVELNSGCLCCTLKGSLMLAVEELREKSGVERVVVESTGVAAPAEMLESMNDSSMKADIEIGPLVTVVDAPKFLKIRPMLGNFYEDQVEYADIVVLNKVDLASHQVLENVRAEIEEINPGATILFAEQCDVDTGILLDGDVSALVGQLPVDSHSEPHNHEHAHDHSGHDHHDHAHAVAESFVLDGGDERQRKTVDAFFEQLPDNVWRVKGFMRIDGESCLVQYTMGQLEIRSAEDREHHNVVFIGKNLDRGDIESRFNP